MFKIIFEHNVRTFLPMTLERNHTNVTFGKLKQYNIYYITMNFEIVIFVDMFLWLVVYVIIQFCKPMIIGHPFITCASSYIPGTESIWQLSGRLK